MSKIMTKESEVILSGRYDREECRTRVVIPGSPLSGRLGRLGSSVPRAVRRG